MKLKSICKEYTITPYIYSQVVLSIVFHKYTGQKTFGFIYPSAMMEGRNLFYGSQVNTMVIDYRFNDEITIKELINQVLLFQKELKKSKAKLSIYLFIR